MSKFKLSAVQIFQTLSARKLLTDVRSAFGTGKRKGDHAIALLHLESSVHNLDEFMAIADKRPQQAAMAASEDELSLS